MKGERERDRDSERCSWWWLWWANSRTFQIMNRSHQFAIVNKNMFSLLFLCRNQLQRNWCVLFSTSSGRRYSLSCLILRIKWVSGHCLCRSQHAISIDAMNWENKNIIESEKLFLAVRTHTSSSLDAFIKSEIWSRFSLLLPAHDIEKTTRTEKNKNKNPKHHHHNCVQCFFFLSRFRKQKWNNEFNRIKTKRHLATRQKKKQKNSKKKNINIENIKTL